MGGIICYHGWDIYGEPGYNHRGDQAPNSFATCAREYRSRNMDYHGYRLMMTILLVMLGLSGGFVRQSQTL